MRSHWSDDRLKPPVTSRLTAMPMMKAAARRALTAPSSPPTARHQAATATLPRPRFDAEADSFLTVVNAQLAASDALVAPYQIALFKALAGERRGCSPKLVITKHACSLEGSRLRATPTAVRARDRW